MAARESEGGGTSEALGRAYDDFADRFTVAFLGTQHAGKTVHCALLKDAAARRLKRHTNGKYLGVATAGAGRINAIVDALYDGQFPEKTPEGEAMQLTVEISSTENGTDIDLIFHDMAGEEYDELLVTEMQAEERIRRILETARIDGKPYGLMAHLIFAKIYVILVDCSDIETWNSSQAYVKEAIRSIYGIKKHIHALHNSKVSSHLAIVFSKCDTLEDEREADEMAKILDEVGAAITKYVGGNVKYFRSRLDSTEMSGYEVRKINAGKRRAKVAAAEGRMAACKDALARAKSRAAAAKSALLAAAENLDSAKSTGNRQSITSHRAAYSRAQKKYDEAVQACATHEDEVGSAQAEIDAAQSGGAPAKGSATHYKPDKPLSYNADEYLDLICWMIKMARREAGH